MLVVMFAVGAMDGGVVSWTTTSAALVQTVPLESVVVHVTTVVPSGNRAVTVKSPVPAVPAGLSHVAGSDAPVDGSSALTL